jgi:predicted DNA-binding transcriptional regulator YafY
MRRADRLFRIVQMLRSGRLKTARALAERLQVSERTIYRDVRDLQLNGQPIEGEAGVGYTLRREFDLPPLMFTPEELTALVLGARLVKAWGGAENAVAASSALARIEAVLPAQLADRLDKILLYAPGFRITAAERKLLDLLHAACLSRNAVRFDYTRLNGNLSTGRSVRPLALYCWSGTWTLVAWCELREDFRVFRIDRLAAVTVLTRTFEQRRGQRLEDYIRRVHAELAQQKREGKDWLTPTPSLPASASD